MTGQVTRRRLLAIAALSPLSTLAIPSTTLAQDAAPTWSPWPLMGSVAVVRNQMLRVSLFNHEEEGAPFASNYRIEVIGIDGSLLGTATGQISPDFGAFADFDLTRGLRERERVQFHVDVIVPRGHIGSTLEVFDQKTGATTFFAFPSIVTDPDRIPSPDALAMGSFGIAAGQLARVSVFHENGPGFPTGPSAVHIDILGLNGRRLASTDGSVSPGRGLFFDYDLAATLRRGERLQFHTHVFSERPGMVGSTLEIIDDKTGATTIAPLPCNSPMPPR
jgi:hypothetical protein